MAGHSRDSTVRGGGYRADEHYRGIFGPVNVKDFATSAARSTTGRSRQPWCCQPSSTATLSRVGGPTQWHEWRNKSKCDVQEQGGSTSSPSRLVRTRPRRHRCRSTSSPAFRRECWLKQNPWAQARSKPGAAVENLPSSALCAPSSSRTLRI